MECINAGFSQFSRTKVKICLLDCQLVTPHQIQVFQGDFLEIFSFPKILGFKALGNVRGKFGLSISGENNLVLFHLWSKGIMLKR